MMGMMQSQTVCPTCHGTGKEIKPEDQCDKCHGSGHIQEKHKLKVKVPAGIDDGQQMRLQNQGEAGTNGGPYGDLYIVFTVTPSRDFKRDGSTIYVDQDISFAQAALQPQNRHRYDRSKATCPAWRLNRGRRYIQLPDRI